MLKSTLTHHYKFDLVVSTMGRCCEFNIGIMVYYELSLLPTVGVTLEKHCTVDVAEMTSLKLCILFVKCCILPKTMTTLCVFNE